MFTNSLKPYIETEMRLKTTEELVEIWTKNNRGDWTDSAFEVVHDILLERLGAVPEQEKPTNKRTDILGQDIQNFLHSTEFLTEWLGVIPFLIDVIILFVLRIFFGNHIPFLAINLLLIFTFPFGIASGIVMIRRREVASSGPFKRKGWLAVVQGVITIIMTALLEIGALIILILYLLGACSMC